MWGFLPPPKSVNDECVSEGCVLRWVYSRVAHREDLKGASDSDLLPLHHPSFSSSSLQMQGFYFLHLVPYLNQTGRKKRNCFPQFFLSVIFQFHSVAVKMGRTKLMHSAALLEGNEHGEASLCLKNGNVESWHLPGTVPAHHREEALRLLMPEVGSFSMR